MRKLKYHPVLIRLGSWEYWPMYVTVLPVVGFWMYQSLRMRNPAFFTQVNPGLFMGGMYGTSKAEINSNIPVELLPASAHIAHADLSLARVTDEMERLGIQFPVILKPDVGERGLNVFKVDNNDLLDRCLTAFQGNVMLQEYVDYPLEISVLCYSMQERKESGVTSVCIKEFLSVIGDGKSTIGELIDHSPRAVLQKERLARLIDLNTIPVRGQRVLLEHIGNHNRGTKFINGEYVDRTALGEIFIPLLENMSGVTFGRFDVRARSLEDLLNGEHYKVIEFNGVNSEPVHVYDPGYPVWKAYRDFWNQWELLRRIAIYQRSRGIKSEPISTAYKSFRDYFRYKNRSQAAGMRV